MPKSVRPERVAPSDWEEVESAEISAEQFAQARPVAEIFPGLFEVPLKSKGRPRLANPKVAVKLRLDADILKAFRATGKGWQTRMNEALKAAKP